MRRLARREPLPAGTAWRWLFFRLARRFTPLIASEEHDGARFIVRTSDAVAGEQLFIYGGSDDREVLERAFATVRRESPGAGATARGVLLEIGANIGTTTVAALRGGYVDRVVAVEAHPETARLLEQNVIVNGLGGKVVVINAAVTDAVGEVELALSEIDSGDHRVSSAEAAPTNGIGARSRIRVPGTTVDALVADGTIDLDNVPLVWIDAQGHEPAILRGARSLLERKVPVLIEYWPEGLRDAGGLESLEELVASNYTRFVDLRATPGAAQPAGALPSLRNVYADGSFTDVLLLGD